MKFFELINVSMAKLAGFMALVLFIGMILQVYYAYLTANDEGIHEILNILRKTFNISFS